MNRSQILLKLSSNPERPITLFLGSAVKSEDGDIGGREVDLTVAEVEELARMLRTFARLWK